MTHYLQIVEANHDDDQFYTLGGAGFKTKKECLANLATIPVHDHDCDLDSRCYILDVLNNKGLIIDDIEISEHTARHLLGVTDLGPLRDASREYNQAVSDRAMDSLVGLGAS